MHKHPKMALKPALGLHKIAGKGIRVVIDPGLQDQGQRKTVGDIRVYPRLHTKRHGMDVVQSVIGIGIEHTQLWLQPKVFVE